MSDDQLREYLPRYGDRIVVTSFAKKMGKKRNNSDSNDGSRKKELTERLLEKMRGQRQGHEHKTRSRSQVGNSNAKKEQRRVEVGWLDFDSTNKAFKQVKAPSGGGTKHETFSLDCTMRDIRECVKECFFPNGKSRRGSIASFHIFITDATHDPIADDVTVEDMYNRGKCKLLRLYLATKKNISEGTVTGAAFSQTADGTLPSTATASLSKQSKPARSRKKVLRLRDATDVTQMITRVCPQSEDAHQSVDSQLHIDASFEENDLELPDLTEADDALLDQITLDQDNTIQFGQITEEQSDLSDTIPLFEGRSQMSSPSSIGVISGQILSSVVSTNGSFICRTTSEENGVEMPLSSTPCSYGPPKSQESLQLAVNSTQNETTVSSAQNEPAMSSAQNETTGSSAPNEPVMSSAPNETAGSSPQNEIAMSPAQNETTGPSAQNEPATSSAHNETAGSSAQSGPAMFPTTSSADPVIVGGFELPAAASFLSPPMKKEVSLRRTIIQQDMVNLFMDDTIVDTPIRVRFIDEAGSDAQGVSRDAYSAFWAEFFSTSACGEEERVPTLFPEYGLEEWRAVGRILLKGYKDCGVYPLRLSLAFSASLILGEAAVLPDVLLQSFRMYLSCSDRDIINRALSGQVLSEDDSDDFLDLLSKVDCKSIPQGADTYPTILRMAHKELIQEPKYALEAMADTARDGLAKMLSDVEKIQTMYDAKKPTARKVIRLLQCTPSNKEESNALAYLKQVIKGLDDSMLKKFLRYFTGADMICTPKIEISFNRMLGLTRAPQAHTCGPLIELPSTYNSYPELRREITSLLEENRLFMDIV